MAEALGNTPAVCRSSDLAPPRNDRLGPRARARIEREVLDLVRPRSNG